MVPLRRVIVYLWVLPTSLVGLPFVAIAILSGGRLRIVDGVLEAHSIALRLILRYCTPVRGGASAITMGHVVLGQDQHALEWTRSHERVHVRQCERWGPLFLPAYLFAGLLALMRGKRMYLDNRFEVEAYENE
jgi:hypothetical protein